MLLGPDSAAKTETQAMVAFVRDHILALLHPFMPFITEELWAVTAEGGVARDDLLDTIAVAAAARPRRPGCRSGDRLGGRPHHGDPLGAHRNEHLLAGCCRIPLVLAGVAPAETDARAQRWGDVIRRMARIADITATATPPTGAVQVLVRGDIVALPLKGVIDLAAEKARLEKEKAKAEADINRIDAKLANPKFVANADPEVVEADREESARKRRYDGRRSWRRWSGSGRWGE